MKRLILVGALSVALIIVFLLLRSGGPDPLEFGLRLERFDVNRQPVDETLEQLILVPGQAPIKGHPLLIFLHGRGSSPGDMLSEELFAALRSEGNRAPLVLLPNGGESSYWHDRADGAWATYLLDEVIPEVERRYPIDRRRVAIGGISMGGFGALHIGLTHDDFCAVGAHSPALFRSWEESAEGAFDDPDDFRENNIIRLSSEAAPSFEDTKIWIDIGEDDPFLGTTQELIKILRDQQVNGSFTVSEGGHDEGYWLAHMSDYIDFYSESLSQCS